jgi:hypothetical protein
VYDYWLELAKYKIKLFSYEIEEELAEGRRSAVPQLFSNFSPCG